ncbi:hypothetical protein L7F22_062305 [Adiantum nelumboides]|nr:hypothetical protein [Adiantum nelumboides]
MSSNLGAHRYADPDMQIPLRSQRWDSSVHFRGLGCKLYSTSDVGLADRGDLGPRRLLQGIRAQGIGFKTLSHGVSRASLLKEQNTLPRGFAYHTDGAIPGDGTWALFSSSQDSALSYQLQPGHVLEPRRLSATTKVDDSIRGSVVSINTGVAEDFGQLTQMSDDACLSIPQNSSVPRGWLSLGLCGNALIMRIGSDARCFHHQGSSCRLCFVDDSRLGVSKAVTVVSEHGWFLFYEKSDPNFSAAHMASGEEQSNHSTSGDAGGNHNEDYGNEYGPPLPTEDELHEMEHRRLVGEATNMILNFAKDPKLAKYMTETAFQDVHAQWKATTTSPPKPDSKKQYSKKELEEEVEARLARILGAKDKGKKHDRKRKKSIDFLGYLGSQSTFDEAKKHRKHAEVPSSSSSSSSSSSGSSSDSSEEDRKGKKRNKKQRHKKGKKKMRV